MIRRIYSWCKGLKIGQRRFIHDRPMVVGRMTHFLHPALWTEEEREGLRYGIRCQTWTGFKWATGPRTEVTHQVYKNLGVLNVVAH